VGLLTELDAFFTDHHDCGDLDAGVDGAVVWLDCTWAQLLRYACPMTTIQPYDCPYTRGDGECPHR
jgi:hypothetical protein